jgi:hypothetical protein
MARMDNARLEQPNLRDRAGRTALGVVWILVALPLLLVVLLFNEALTDLECLWQCLITRRPHV